jgi:ATP/maltotriose-dependent transcriptional regulator MalT
VEGTEPLAVEAYLAGRHEEAVQLWVRAFQERAAAGEVERAASCAYWLAFIYINRNEFVRATGWVSRGQELLGDRECRERGYLLMARGMTHLLTGEPEVALAFIEQARAIAESYDDIDLSVLTRLGHGHLLIELGQPVQGMQLLDSLLVAVTTGEASTAVAGLAYCAVIGTCFVRFDLDRAQQWTAALTDFCESQPDLVPYSGTCLVHRAELLQLHGEWTAAAEAADDARVRFELGSDDQLLGSAVYARAEIDRLRGDFERAERGYREAGLRGRDPQPGLALVRLAQGRVDDAAATVRRLVAEITDPARRPTVLAAHVAVMLPVGDVDRARTSCAELEQLAESSDTPFVRATADHCHGALLLADGQPAAALVPLRRAVRDWLGLDAPYEVARARELVGRACRALGDEDTAVLEFEAARSAYQSLGAASDLARVGGKSTDSAVAVELRRNSLALTAREVEVLRLVATGATNRAIASKLVLSEKTVARHLSNVFTKIDVPSRAAATAFAYERGLV